MWTVVVVFVVMGPEPSGEGPLAGRVEVVMGVALGLQIRRGRGTTKTSTFAAAPPLHCHRHRTQAATPAPNPAPCMPLYQQGPPQEAERD